MKKLYTIKIPKITLFGHHGCYDEEKENGQQFEITVYIKYLPQWNKNDDRYDNLKSHLNYADLENMVSNIFHAKRYNLLEPLSNDIASSITNKYDIKAVNVEVKKNNPEGMKAEYVKVGCEIFQREYRKYEGLAKRL